MVTYSVFANIPPMPLSFKGRNNQVEEILSIIQSQAVAMTGSGGIGKSALATAVLHDSRVVQDYKTSRFFVRCDGPLSASDPAGSSNSKEKLISIIATSLDISTSDRSMENAVVRFFSKEPSILVLDNLETLWDVSNREFDEFLQRLVGVSMLKLIVTFRGTLPRSMAWRTWKEVELDILDPTSAQDVFLRLSDIQEQPVYPHLDDILAAVEYLPLAIVLLASQATREFGLEQLWEEWTWRRSEMLKDGRYRREMPGSRELSVHASIEFSLNRPMMTRSARTLLSQLSLLPDGASPNDLQSLFPPHRLKQTDDRSEKVLQSLSLAYYDRVDQHESKARLRIHACTREYLHYRDKMDEECDRLPGICSSMHKTRRQ